MKSAVADKSLVLKRASNTSTKSPKTADDRAAKGSKAFKNIELCIFLSGISCFAQLYMFQPILPELSGVFHISPAQSSFAVSASTLGLALGLIIELFISDRIPRKRLIATGLISSSCLTILSSFLNYFPLLVAFNVLKGMLLSGATSVIMSYVAEEVKASALAKATSLYVTGNAIGGMGGRIITTLITSWISWRWATFVLGFICLAFGLAFLRRLPASKHFYPVHLKYRNKLVEMRDVLKTPFLLGMSLLGAIILGCFVSVYNYIGFRLESPVFNLSSQVIAFIYLMYLVGIMGSIFSSFLSERLGSERVVDAMELMAFAGLLFMNGSYLWTLILGLIFFTISFFGAHATVSRLVAQYDARLHSTAISMYFLFFYVGSSFLGTGSGVIMNRYGWRIFTLVLCLIILLGMGLLYVSFHLKRRSKAKKRAA